MTIYPFVPTMMIFSTSGVAYEVKIEATTPLSNCKFTEAVSNDVPLLEINLGR